MTHAKPVRRPQAERSEQMTETIIATTLDLMYEQGMAATSTEAVARRAGVSRGAILHHYPQNYLAVARTNDDLRRHLGPVSLKFNRALDDIWRTFFHLSDKQIGRIDITLNLTLCLMRGMGVQTVLQHHNPGYFDELIASWKVVLGNMLEPVPAKKIRRDAPPST